MIHDLKCFICSVFVMSVYLFTHCWEHSLELELLELHFRLLRYDNNLNWIQVNFFPLFFFPRSLKIQNLCKFNCMLSLSFLSQILIYCWKMLQNWFLSLCQNSSAQQASQNPGTGRMSSGEWRVRTREASACHSTSLYAPSLCRPTCADFNSSYCEIVVVTQPPFKCLFVCIYVCKLGIEYILCKLYSCKC